MGMDLRRRDSAGGLRACHCTRRRPAPGAQSRALARSAAGARFGGARARRVPGRRRDWSSSRHTATPRPRIARQLAEMLAANDRRAAGHPVVCLEGAAHGSHRAGARHGRGRLGDEGYDLTVGPQEVTLKAAAPAGLVLRRADVPPAAAVLVEYEALNFGKPRPATLSGGPHRRSSALRVARRDARRRAPFLRRRRRQALHRSAGALQVQPAAPASGRRPGLAHRDQVVAGARHAAAGARKSAAAPAGSTRRQQYADLVAYAADRFITIVPEIDMPGHTNAALSSYAELNCNGVAPEPYTGTEVGFSALCVDKDVTYQLHRRRGARDCGDDAGPVLPCRRRRSEDADAGAVQARSSSACRRSSRSHGKQMIGWDEVASRDAAADVDRPALASRRVARASWRRAPHLILSPANRAYLDMKYDDEHGARAELGGD